MKLYTAVYDGNFPSNKEIQAPLGSKYGFALGFTRGSEKWKLEPGEVKMDGLSADSVLSSGEFVFMRESGMVPGLKVHEIVADDQAFQASADNVVSVYNSRPTVMSLPVYTVELSTLIDKDTEVTYDQFGLIDRYGSSQEGVLSAEWHSPEGVQVKIYPDASSAFYSRYQGAFWFYDSTGATKTDKALLTPAGKI